MVKALETDGPVLLDVRVAQEEGLLPDHPARRSCRYMVEAPRAASRVRRRRPGPAGGQARGPAPAGAIERRKYILSNTWSRTGRRAGARRRGPSRRRLGLQHRHAAVGPTDDPTVSRITLTLDGAVHPIDQVTKQLHKLVNVGRGTRHGTERDGGARDGAVRGLGGRDRAETIEFAEIFRPEIVDVARRTMTIEATGSADKIEAFERMVRPHGLVEMVRTGEIAIGRGSGLTFFQAPSPKAFAAAVARWSASPSRLRPPTPAPRRSPRAWPRTAGSAGSSRTASSRWPASASRTRPPRVERAASPSARRRRVGRDAVVEEPRGLRRGPGRSGSAASPSLPRAGRARPGRRCHQARRPAQLACRSGERPSLTVNAVVGPGEDPELRPPP